MAVYKVRLYRPHKAQWEVHKCTTRFRVVVAGRRWGKTTMALNEALAFAINNPGARVWWVGPTYKHVKKPFRDFCAAFRSKSSFFKINRSEMFVEFTHNGSILEFHSGERYDNLRGEGLKFVVIDEAAFCPEGLWTEVIRPALADWRGRALLISTPLSKTNWFYRLYLNGIMGKRDWASFRFPSWTNPFLAPEEIEALKRELPPHIFKREIAAEFSEGRGALFRDFHRRVEDYQIPVEPEPGRRYFAGIDIGFEADYTVIIVLDDTGRLVYFDRFRNLSWRIQKEKIMWAVNKYKPYVFIDATGIGHTLATMVAEEWANTKKVTLSKDVKKVLIDNLALAFEKDKITIPNIPVLLDELDVFGYEVTSTGVVKYAAPVGCHDDTVLALALAYGALLQGASSPVVIAKPGGEAFRGVYIPPAELRRLME